MDTNNSQNIFKAIHAFQPLLESFISSAKISITDEALLPGFHKAHDEILKIVGTYYEAEEQIRQEFAGFRITQIIKNERMAAARATAETALAEVSDLSNRQQQIEARLFAKPLKSDVDRILDLMLQQEIRRELKGMDTLSQTSLVLSRLEQNPEDPLLDALVGAPSFLKTITPAEEKGYLRKRGIHRNPELAGELTDIETVNELISGMRSVATAAIAAQ